MKSTRSSMSLKSVRITTERDENKLLEFNEFVEIACRKFNIPGKVVVNKNFQNDNFLRSLKQEPRIGKKSVKGIPVLGTRPSFTLLADRDEDVIVTIPHQEENVFVISAIYNNQNKLVEILLSETKIMPRIIIQLIGVIAPQYPFLTRIAIKKCRINKYTIYEMSKFLQFTSVTDVCLDGSTFGEANFALLLQNTRISSLSVSRCSINDVVCETMATQLHYSEPMQCHLTTLNLSINRITDVGARSLGLALRSNRYLRYLNLAGNCITDEGANHILKPLMYFPLTVEEIQAERVLYGEYLKDKYAIAKIGAKTGSQLKSQDDSVFAVKSAKSWDPSVSKLKNKNIVKPSSRTTKGKGKGIAGVTHLKRHSSAVNVTAVSTCENLCFIDVAPFVHPFSDSNVEKIDGHRYCKGNLVLCYLNLAYNNISYLTLKKLNEILQYQSKAKSSSDYGLIKLIIEGNDLPSAVGCSEIDTINDLLKRSLINMAAKHKNEAKTKYRMKSFTSFNSNSVKNLIK